jgi:hypothetical protein
MSAFLNLLVPVVLAAIGVLPLERNTDQSDEQLLRKAKFDTSDRGLVAYLQSQSCTQTQAQEIEQLIRRLGHRSYRVRVQAMQELIGHGVPTLPALRRALPSRDPEIARRVESCIETIERCNEQRNMLIAAVIRTLAARKADGAAEALLAYLPSCENDWIEEEVDGALLAIGLRDHRSHDCFAAELTHHEPSRRAAAALVAGRSSDPAARQKVRQLLTDAEPKVRLRAAQGLIAGKDQSALPTLIALIAEPSTQIYGKAEELLFQIAGEKTPHIALADGSNAARTKYRDAWAAWWREQGQTIDWNAVVTEEPNLRYPLVVEMDSNKIWQMGGEGRPIWVLRNLQGPMDAQLLPNGRVLVAEYQGRVVTERDRDGKVYWSKKVEDSPIACRRLPSGNTFIATHNVLTEVMPDGEAVYYRSTSDGRFQFSAQRLMNGRIISLANPGIIQELEAATGKVLKTIRLGTPFGGWCGIETLPGGRYLVAVVNNGKVMELDPAGKVLWECTVSGAVYATRLPGGRTLVASTLRQRLVEVDRAGKIVNEIRTEGRPWKVRAN